MTKAINEITLDGIYQNWVAIDTLSGSFLFTPARLKEITKPPGQTRGLLIANPRKKQTKIVQKAAQVILQAIFEPHFFPSSFGFRPPIGALDQLYLRGGHITWNINGDISKCFDRIPHQIILNELKKHISCVRFLTLIERALKAGYLDTNKVHVKSDCGTPQVSILSPLLAVLDKLDKFIENGVKRRNNPKYEHLAYRRKYFQNPR